MRTSPLRVVLAAIALLLCKPSLADDIVVGGTGLGIGAVRMIGAAYAVSRPGNTVTVPASIGSDGGINAVAGGAFALSLSARTLLPAETAQGLVAEIWVRTPLVFAAAASVAARVNFSTDDILAIYGDGDLRWPTGPRVRPVLRPIREAVSVILTTRFPRLESLIERGLRSKGSVVALSDREAMEIGERSPGTLVTTTLLAIRSDGSPLIPVSLDGVEPSIVNMENGLYPTSATLWLVRKADASPGVLAFVDFLRSDAVGVILRVNGGVPARR